MRARYFIAVIVAAAIGIAIKVVFLSSPAAVASADSPKAGTGLDVSKLPVTGKLPEQAMHDMSFVYTDAD